MVSIFKAPKKQTRQKKLTLTIDRLDHEGTGVCRRHQPVIFVPKTLPGEMCDVQVQTSAKNVWQGELIKVVDKSEQRVEPQCRYFEQCGGCQTQYASADFMLAEKQQALDSLFQKQLSLKQVPWQMPLADEHWHYRRKARLAIDAQNKSAIKLGFRTQKDNAILNIDNCPVLDKSLNTLLPELKQVLNKVAGVKYLGHISLLRSDNGVQVVFRFTKDIGKPDRELLAGFGDRLAVKLVLEINKNQFEVLSKDDSATYISPSSKLKLFCEPNDFIQVNDKVNKAMVAQAADWLSLTSEDEVADLFCGIGNFSLALAGHCKKVVGFEGVETMVQRAAANADLNQVTNIEFECVDLNESNALQNKTMSGCDALLLDPSRAGAKSVVEQLTPSKWKKVLYVSCHAGTFVRDVKIMQAKGFEMVKVSVLDMFPQTSHIELMALFLPKK